MHGANRYRTGGLLTRRRLASVTVTLTALAVRLIWLLRPSADSGDSLEYLRLAHNIATQWFFSDDGTQVSSYRPPLYPALLALVERIVGQPVPGVLVVQCVLGAITVWLVFRITEQVFGLRTAIVAAAMLALAPMTSRYAAVALTETLFTFLIIVSVGGWTFGYPALAGLAFGLATLTRATTLPLLVLLTASVVITPVDVRRKLAMFVAVAALTVAPWAVRNLVQVHRLTIADAGWGVNLLYGTVDLERGSNRWSQLIRATERLDRPNDDLPDVSAARLLDAEARDRAEAIRRIRERPGHWVLTRLRQWPQLVLNTGDYFPIEANRFTFNEARREGRFSTIALKLGCLGGSVLLCVFAAYGVWVVRSRLLSLAAIWIFPLFLALAHAPMYVEPRYGLPLVPFLVMFAAVGICSSAERLPGIVKRD